MARKSATDSKFWRDFVRNSSDFPILAEEVAWHLFSIERFLWHLVPPGLRRIRRFGWWGNRLRTEKLTLLRRLLGVRPPESADEPPPTPREEAPEEPPDPELRRLEEEQGTPRKCRTCGGKMELTYQTPRPTVADLMRMPPNMEMTVESGPVQLYLPLSAFL